MTQFTPPVISGRIFKNETVILDGFRFEKCRFENCTLVYSGGPADSAECYFAPDTLWKFEGPAGMVMQVLPLFAWRFSFGEGYPDDVIRFPSDAT